MNFQISKERCLKLAKLGESYTIGAGAPSPREDASSSTPSDETKLSIVRAVAFGRFVEMKRSELDLSVEQLAEAADIDSNEVICIEKDVHYQPDPRAVVQLASVLKVPGQGFLELAGLVRPRSQNFFPEMTKFAARSESLAHLSDDSRELLEHFAAVLADEA
ncbi:MAG: helix-turn-helix transcriptional regulator [Verrucomicrobiaceae bacterium]|nr:helix-turn-helix transcriptional regulator [Verrucomicrobiaceae bacterium]